MRRNLEMSLTDMCRELDNRRKEDYAAPRNRMSVDRENNRYKLNLGDRYSFPMNEHAMTQLNSSIAPGFGTYAKWLHENDRHDVYIENVNNALSNDDRKAQVRTVAGEDSQPVARAVLSDAFKAIDDDVVYGVALPVISEEADKFKAIGGRRTNLRSYLKIVTRRPVFSVNAGGRTREFSAGFIMRNSEVGMGFCEFMAFLTDSYCDNGCIFSKEVIADVKYVHRGARVGTDFGPILEDRFKQAELASIRATIAEATGMALKSEHYGKLQRWMEESAARQITAEDAGAVIDVVGQRVGLTKNEVEKVKVHFDSNDTTQFGIQAAITRLAQDVDSYDKRIALEAAGGQVAVMSDRVWESVNKLAS